MITVSGIIVYLGLFIGLCLFVVVFIASYNIIKRSYKPLNAILILAPIYIIILICTFLSVINLINVLANLKSQGFDTLVTF